MSVATITTADLLMSTLARLILDLVLAMVLVLVLVEVQVLVLVLVQVHITEDTVSLYPYPHCPPAREEELPA